jgi:hypothetical protein
MILILGMIFPGEEIVFMRWANGLGQAPELYLRQTEEANHA